MNPIPTSAAGNWKRRDFLRAAALSAAAAAAPAILKARPRNADRPNILLILADDLGFSDLGCYGSEIHTPQIDSIAARGLRFTQFYNCSVCCPTRASLLCGVFPHQAGMGWWTSDTDPRPRLPGPYQGYLSDQCVTIAEVLRTSRYRTLMSGKWHVGSDRPHWPVDRGFERYFGLLVGAANYFNPCPTAPEPPSHLLERPVSPRTVRMALDDQPYFPPKEGFYMTDAFTDHAVGFLDGEGRSEDPFLLYLAYTAPHCPLQAPAEDIAKYRGRYQAGWDQVRAQRYQKMKASGLTAGGMALSPRDPEVPAWEDEKEKDLMDLKMAIYAAQIERMDQGIGRVLAKLREIGKEENTLVLFLSDNGACAVPHIAGAGFPERLNRPPYLGGPLSNEIYGRPWANVSDTPLRRFKYWMEEGGISTPLIAAWPGVIKNPGGFCHEIGHVMDFMPTFLDIAGADYPTRFRGQEILPFEGSSLAPLLRGEGRIRPGTLCWEFEGSRAARQGAWKLVGDKKGPWSLYNLQLDRTELNDLAPEQPDRVHALESEYNRWAKRCGVGTPRFRASPS